MKKASAQKEEVLVEEIKEISASLIDSYEDLDSAGSGEVTSSANSQSSLEMAQEVATTADPERLNQIEVDEEPLILL